MQAAIIAVVKKLTDSPLIFYYLPEHVVLLAAKLAQFRSIKWLPKLQRCSSRWRRIWKRTWRSSRQYRKVLIRVHQDIEAVLMVCSIWIYRFTKVYFKQEQVGWSNHWKSKCQRCEPFHAPLRIEYYSLIIGTGSAGGWSSCVQAGWTCFGEARFRWSQADCRQETRLHVKGSVSIRNPLRWPRPMTTPTLQRTLWFQDQGARETTGLIGREAGKTSTRVPAKGSLTEIAALDWHVRG